MKKLFVATFLAAMLNFIPAAAHAEPQCNTRDKVLSQLKELYGEDPIALGVTHNGGLIEVLSNGKTFSIIISSPQGMSCLVAAGEGWRQFGPRTPDPASLGDPS